MIDQPDKNLMRPCKLGLMFSDDHDAGNSLLRILKDLLEYWFGKNIVTNLTMDELYKSQRIYVVEENIKNQLTVLSNHFFYTIKHI